MKTLALLRVEAHDRASAKGHLPDWEGGRWMDSGRCMLCGSVAYAGPSIAWGPALVLDCKVGPVAAPDPED